MRRSSFEIKMGVLQYLLKHKNAIITHIICGTETNHVTVTKFLGEMKESNLISIEELKGKKTYNITSFGVTCFKRNKEFWRKTR